MYLVNLNINEYNLFKKKYLNIDIKLTRLLISFSLSGADLAVALKQTTLVLAKLASSKIT